jgi:hypothetical protein
MENYNRVYESEFGTYYYLNGEFHRIDGPAFEGADGTKCWYQNGLLHRIDGPAIECSDGYKQWFQNGLRHRIDGPAEEYNGKKYWWIEGKKINCNSQEEFERYVKLKLFW